MRNVRQSRRTSRVEEAEDTFRTADISTDQTDYSFDYTNDQPSRDAVAKSKNYARKSTSNRNSITPQNKQKTSSKTTTTNPRTADNEPPSDGGRKNARKPAHPKSAYQKQIDLFKEIRRLQNSTDLLIPRLPFGRIVHEILNEQSNNRVDRMTATCIGALQEATEQYLVQIFSDAYLLTQHRGRVTLVVQDIEILKVLKIISVR